MFSIPRARNGGQPPGQWAINPALRATGVFVGNQGVNLVTRREATLTNGVIAGPANGRYASLVGGSSTIAFSANANDLFPDLGNATIAVYRRSKDTTQRGITTLGYSSGASDRVLLLAGYSDSNLYFDFGDATGGSGRLSASFAKVTTPETIVVVASKTRGREAYRNGVLIGSDASATASRPSNTSAVVLGGTAGLNSDEEEIYLVVVSPYAWTPGQIRRWSRRPYAETFARGESWAPVSAGGGTFKAAWARQRSQVIGAGVH